jgi:hypothetical protein
MQPLPSTRIQRRGGVIVANAFTGDRDKTEEWTIVDKSKNPPKKSKFTFQIKDIEEKPSEEEE